MLEHDCICLELKYFLDTKIGFDMIDTSLASH